MILATRRDNRVNPHRTYPNSGELMDLIAALTVFHRISETGSFSKAARETSSSQPAAPAWSASSRRISVVQPASVHSGSSGSLRPPLCCCSNRHTEMSLSCTLKRPPISACTIAAVRGAIGNSSCCGFLLATAL